MFHNLNKNDTQAKVDDIQTVRKIHEIIGSSDPLGFGIPPLSMPLPRLRSSHGIPVLLKQALTDEKNRLEKEASCSLFQHYMNAGSGSISTIEKALAERYKKITESIGGISNFLNYSERDINEAAKRLAKLDIDTVEKIAYSETLLGAVIPGKSLMSQALRVSDPRFWRRALRVRIMRAREHFFLRMKLVGRGKEPYTSDATVKMRSEQLRRQEKWLKDCVMIPRFYTHEMLSASDDFKPLALADFAKGATEHFAKLYAFVSALDELGIEAGLSSGMLTITLEPEFHPNPSHGDECWNDDSPRFAHMSFSKRWQAILRDLHRLGIRISGLRVVEPHKDGCPHYHIWMLYRPENETTILSTVMKYFKKKLKIRAPHKEGEINSSMDEMYDDRLAFNAAKPRSTTHKKEGAQVELSRIDPSISSGASYAMKYLLKAANAGDDLNAQIGNNKPEDAQARKKREQHLETVKRVDAYRSVWGIHQGQLFGIAKCLGVWDELRRVTKAPLHPELKKLWMLARGGKEDGRIAAGAQQRGDAKGFLKALGGLDACRKSAKQSANRFKLARLLEEGKNRYGDTIYKTKGITLLMKERVQVSVEKINAKTDKVKLVLIWRTQTSILESVRTRLTEWLLVQKGAATQALARAEELFLNSLKQQSGKSNQRLNCKMRGLESILM